MLIITTDTKEKRSLRSSNREEIYIRNTFAEQFFQNTIPCI